MPIEQALFRYGIRFSEPTYVLRVTIDGVDTANLTFPATGTLDPTVDYFFTEDGSASDLCQLLEDCILSHPSAGFSTVAVSLEPSLLSEQTLTIAVDADVLLHWSHASTTLDATIFGWTNDADSEEDQTLGSPNLPMGLVYLNRPVSDDGRPQQPVVSGSVKTIHGDVIVTVVDAAPLKERMLSVEKLHRSYALEEYAPSTTPYATIESMHVRAMALGHSIHYVPDATDPDTYSELRMHPIMRSLERDGSTQSRMLWKWKGDFVQVADYVNGAVVVPGPSFANEYSLAFDGVDEYVTCGDVDTLNGATLATISFWVRSAAWGSGTEGIMGKTRSSHFDVRALSPSTLRWYIASTSAYTPSDAVFGDDTWFHVVLAFDGGQADGSRVTIYVDGADATGTPSGVQPTTMGAGNNDALVIGALTATPSGLWTGNIDEVAIWAGHAATLAQAQEIYNGGNPTDLDDYSGGAPDHWWRMGDGDTYPTILDHGSGTTANGTMTNMESGDIVAVVP